MLQPTFFDVLGPTSNNQSYPGNKLPMTSASVVQSSAEQQARMCQLPQQVSLGYIIVVPLSHSYLAPTLSSLVSRLPSILLAALLHTYLQNRCKPLHPHTNEPAVLRHEPIKHRTSVRSHAPPLKHIPPTQRRRHHVSRSLHRRHAISVYSARSDIAPPQIPLALRALIYACLRGI